MKAIITKYLQPTDTKGGRIKARVEGVKPIIVSYDHSLSTEQNHKKAALALIDYCEWDLGEGLAGGILPDGNGYAYCFID